MKRIFRLSSGHSYQLSPCKRHCSPIQAVQYKTVTGLSIWQLSIWQPCIGVEALWPLAFIHCVSVLNIQWSLVVPSGHCLHNTTQELELACIPTTVTVLLYKCYRDCSAALLTVTLLEPATVLKRETHKGNYIQLLTTQASNLQ